MKELYGIGLKTNINKIYILLMFDLKNQTTIKNKIYISGITLHSGKISNLIIEPADSNYGIRFNGLCMSPLNIHGTKGMTMLGNINQIEHLISCLYALGIDNLNILVDVDELPILDGCNKKFIEEIKKVGIKIYDEPKKVLKISETIIVRENDSYIKFEPHNNDNTIFECVVDFPYVGVQNYTWDSFDTDDYIENISNAITFFWDKQIENEYKLDRCKGVQKNINCIIFGPGNNFDNNELARHKLLDLIGDLNVINCRLPGKFKAYKCGHKINNKMINEIYNRYYLSLNIKLPIEYFKFNSFINTKLIKDKILKCIDDKQFINSEYILEFENNLSKFIGCKHVLTTNSGTSALQLCLMSLELSKESIVVVPNITFWATYEAVKLTGFRVLVIDVDDDFQLDLNLLKIANEIYDIKVVLMVHLYGYISKNYNNIRTFCENENIYLLEDGSHSLGSKYKNNYVLKNSYLSGVSLYPTKILGSSGNAGFVTTNDDDLAKKIKMYRDNGRDSNNSRYEHFKIGGNFSINSIQAIYSNESLKYFNEKLNKLNFISKNYELAFKKLKFMKYLSIDNCTSNGYMSIIISQNFNYVYNELIRRGIDVKNIYPKTITEQPGFDSKDFKYLNNKGNKLCKSVINLPIYYDLDPNEQKYIIDQIINIDKLKVVIMGLGRMGSFHLNELRKNNEFEIVGFIDPNLDEYEGLLKLQNLEVAKKLGVNFIFICSNTESHYECIMNCISNNLNFFIEKPVVISQKYHEKINLLVKENKLFVSVGLIERFNPCFLQFKFDDNIKKIKVLRKCRPPNNKKLHLINFDLLIHDIDLLQFYFKAKIEISNYKRSIMKSSIFGKIKNTEFEITVEYSNTDFKRFYILYFENDNIEINLDTKNNLIYEHNDIINFFKGSHVKGCNLDESLSLISLINKMEINYESDHKEVF